MNELRPPKEINLETVFFTQPGFQPSRGRTSELEAIRGNYARHEATLRLQHSGLFLARALLLRAENLDDAEAVQFARRCAAIPMLGAGWHSYAEVRPGHPAHPPREVRRRRLELPDYTHLQIEERPSAREIAVRAEEAVVDCIMEAKRAVNAARSRNPEQLYHANEATGKALAHTATQIVSAGIGEAWLGNPSMSAYDSQVHMMLEGQHMLADALALSNEVGAVPSLAMMTDPNGSALQTWLKDTMPKPLVNDYYAMEKALMTV